MKRSPGRAFIFFLKRPCSLYFLSFFTEMQNMQSAAREHTQRVFQETDKLRKQLIEKESYMQRRSRQLNELVAQTDMERRKLEEERKKVWMHPHSFFTLHKFSE